MFFCKIDPVTGLWLEDIIFSTQPTDDVGEPDPAYIGTPCPGGFFLPRWNGERWVEGKNPEEIAAIQAAGQPEPTPQAQWRADIENALVELAEMIAGGE
jgi:hypothetical protein